jgi:signal transduction histidine kinase/ligand-binding sensor domain-containing protein/DNA-binding response OmpR family regulator
MNCRWLLGFCIVIFYYCTSIAQSGVLEFANISTENGLSNSDINAIVQDNDGFIWFGTEYGLNRFDGYEIKFYRNIPGDSTSLPDNSINCLYVDFEGALWIGTSRGGLAKYIKSSDSFVSYLHDRQNPNSLSFNFITFVTEDKYNTLWICTLEGLCRYNRELNNFSQFTSQEKDLSDKKKNFYNRELPGNGSKYLKDINLRSIAADKQGNLWIGYERDGLGMLNISNETFYHFPLPQKLIKWTGDNAINYILEVDNELWLATRFAGIFVFNRKTEEYRRLETKFMDQRITYLLPDKNNIIWIATKSGLYNYNRATGEIASYFHQKCNYYSLTNNSISCLLIDHQGMLWAGSLQGGVNYTINQKGFQTYKHELCKNINPSQLSISAIFADSRNKLWIGYFDNGIDIIDRNNNSKKFYYDIPVDGKSMSTGTIFCIFEDSKHRIWIGSYVSGLFMYNPATGSFKNYQNDPDNLNSISGNDVRSVCEDNEHQLWLAIHGKGLVRFNPESGKCERISFPQNGFGLSPANNWVYKVYIDKEENLWVTSVAGVSLSQDMGKSFENYHHNQKNLNSESLDVIWTLYDDGDLLWMGSNMGLSIFDKKQKVFTRVFTKKEGLPTDAIAGILADDKNRLWISTYSGLVRMDPKNHDQIKVFTQTDGLQGDQFFANACFKDASGEMFFGGINGYTSFFPDSIKEYKFIPPVEITDFKLFNKSENILNSKILKVNISETKDIVLKYSQNVITFNFVALNFAEPEKNQYAYKLEGFEKNWNVSVNKREATYTNLSPGTYVFRVKASNNDGVWNEKGKSIVIKVKPPFWLSIYAFIVYILVVFLSLIQYKRNIQNREELKRKLALEHMEAEKQIEMNDIRLRFFTNISHEFRTSLSLIIGPAETMINENDNFTEQQKQQVSLIRHSAQRLLRLINQLLDLRKIEAGNIKLYPSLGELMSFCRDIAKSFEYLARQNQINFIVKTENDLQYARFDADKIEKIVYNLISNAFKFTGNGGTIQFITGIEYTNQMPALYIEVTDNGIGIPEESIDKVFERFYQVESSARKIKGGTGIGLSLVKELVDMHKGTIKVKSKFKQQDTQSDSGTTFTVSIPLDIREVPEEIDLKNDISPTPLYNEIEKSEIGNTANPLVLIVEDNADLRLFVYAILKPYYRIIEAENGITGLKAAFDKTPDIIISDIMMPGMQGTELCKTLKTDDRTSHIPIVLLTALSSVENKIEGFELGADDYITKPFNAEILITRISNLIENRQRIRSRFKKQLIVEPKDITITSIDEKFIKKAIDVVEQHMDDTMFDIEVFTKEMNVSRTLLHTKLKAITDLSATEFIKTLRLKRASRLLKEGQLSVSEVSIMVGFNSRNYFTKCFTELYGVSPSEYLGV